MEKNKNDIKVSVLVITYNHELFLRECLDSIVCQKTNFAFEIIVHDDKSSDGTTKIIEEYKQKYPNLIVPIYEKENQFTLGKNIAEDCMLPFAKGKYIAICEGDDRWCDENKLQKQFDFMESNPDYVACFHNTVMHDLRSKKKDYCFNKFKEITELKEEHIFDYRYVHTSSYFVTKENYKSLNFGYNAWFGDFVLLTSLFARGKMAALPDVMSIYNLNNPKGVMKSKINVSHQKIMDAIFVEIEYLRNYNEYTNYRYNKSISMVLSKLIAVSVFDRQLNLSKTKQEYKRLLKKHRKTQEYKQLYKNSSLKGKLKLIIKYHLPKKIFIKLTNKG